MNSAFNTLLDLYKSTFQVVSKSKNLEELKDNYTEYSVYRENIEDWMIANTEPDSEEYDEYYKILDKEDYRFAIDFGLPVFCDLDPSYMEAIFNEHTSYFQRYGCMDFYQVISWDDKNVLYEDEIGNCEIITRPDVLLKQND